MTAVLTKLALQRTPGSETRATLTMTYVPDGETNPTAAQIDVNLSDDMTSIIQDWQTANDIDFGV